MDSPELDEFTLIKRISSRVTQISPGAIGIGDDCAVIPQNNEECLLVTTDMLIEDIHFLRRGISPRELGHKSLAVNLSDIAAMGGFPQSAFLSLGLPRQSTISWVDGNVPFFVGTQSV
jgi:thiamine-monophosphate kinase